MGSNLIHDIKENTLQAGWVYVLTNPGIPGLVKIGYTKNDPQQRARELYGTGVAYPFEVAYQLRCAGYRAVERAAHALLDEYRVNDGREFFACTVQDAVEAIQECAGSNMLAEQDFRVQTASAVLPSAAAAKSSRNGLRHVMYGAALLLAALWGVWAWFDASGNAAATVQAAPLQQENMPAPEAAPDCTAASCTDAFNALF